MNEFYKKILANFSAEKNIYNPNIEKIILHSGISKKNKDKILIKKIFDSIQYISGQKPIFSKIKKSISNFKSKKGDLAGIYVTLRKKNMWNFYHKLIKIVLPRIREFKGYRYKSLDRFGNLHFGINDVSIFPDFFEEVKFGLNISIILKNLSKNFKEFYKIIKFPIE